jgi:hypothetical protein
MQIYIWSIITVFLIILLVQIIYIQTKLTKYSKDDYYKQLLVKNRYVEEQTYQQCSNFNIYVWQINSTIANYLNDVTLKPQIQTILKPISFLYSVPTKIGLQSVSVVSTDLFFIPLVNSPPTTRFINDFLSKRIDYISCQYGVYRCSYLQDFKSQMGDFFMYKGLKTVENSLDNTSIIVLSKLPTISAIKQINFELQEAIDDSTPDILIQSFAGDSRQDFPATELPNVMQVFGYII